MLPAAELLLTFGLLCGVLNPGAALLCYHCQPHEAPECYNRPIVCPPGEVCALHYDDHGKTVNCRKENDCYNDTSCPHDSGHDKHGCSRCCKTDECVSHHVPSTPVSPGSAIPLATLPGFKFAAPPHLGCPDKCPFGNMFPCLISGPACPIGQFCKINIDEHGLGGKCHKDISHCYDEMHHHSDAVCAQGTIHQFAQHDQCTFCCTDTSCPVVSFLNPGTSTQPVSTTPLMQPASTAVQGNSYQPVSKNSPMQTISSSPHGNPSPSVLIPQPLGCADKCQHGSLYACLASGPLCPSGHMCKIHIDGHGLSGKCHTDSQHCYDEMYQHSDAVCSQGTINQFDQHNHCTFCCTDTSCPVVSFLNPSTSTASPATTTSLLQPTSSGVPNTVVQTTAALPHGNPLLSGRCDDQFGSTCNTEQCKTKSGIQNCAKTCGLCTLINKTFTQNGQCEDQLIDNECGLFKLQFGICNSTVSKYTCPRTCEICDEILMELVLQIINTTPSPLVTTADTCVDTLNDMPCSALPNVCNNTLASFVCRKYCGLCDSSVTDSILDPWKVPIAMG